MLNKGRSKFLITLLVVLMVASVLSACSGKNNNNAASSGTGASTASAQVEEKKADPVELSIFHWDFEGVNDASSAIYQKIQEKLNVRINPVTASWNDWEEKLNIIIASGDMPDILVSYGVQKLPQYQQWIKEGMLLPLTDYADSYPNLKGALDRFDSLAKVTGGKHYGLPVALKDSDVDFQVDGHNILIRKDWLDNLGLSMPTTIDEFYAVAKAFTENDPDGNGKNDTYGLSSSSGGFYWNYPFYNAFGGSWDRWYKVDGQWQPEIISDGMKQALSFMNKLYLEKILDPEFMLLTDEQWREKFVTGKVGFFINNLNATYQLVYDDLKALYPDKDPLSMVTHVGALTGTNGQKRWDGQVNFWTQTSINANTSEEKKQKALELLDYLLSEEGQDLMLNGVEGVHYQKDGDKYIPLMDAEARTEDRSDALQDLVTWNNDYESPYAEEEAPAVVAAKEALKSVDPYAYPDELAFLNISEEDMDPSIPGQLLDLFVERVIKLIATSSNFDAEFDDFRQTWLDKGGDKYIEAVNKQAAAEGR